MTRFAEILLVVALAVTQAAAATPPHPAPPWSVYVPMGEADASGVGDSARKCHWYQKTDAGGNPVGSGAWYTHLVFHNGVLITDNADPAIWNGDAVLFLTPVPDNPAEVVPVVDGVPLTATSPYTVVRLVLVRPGDPGMPPNPVTSGSPNDEPARGVDEQRAESTVPAAYWVAADECSQDLWRELMGDRHPVDLAAASHDAALLGALATDGADAPGSFVGFDRPELYVSFGDARSFCVALSTAIGSVARLPAEDEWEYACRAGRDSAFNTETGYTLRGPEWHITDTGTPPQLLDPADYDSYFVKSNPEINGRNRPAYPDPTTLTSGRVYVAGSWQTEIRTVGFTAVGGIDALLDFTALAEVEANFDSRYRRWYLPAYRFAWTSRTDSRTGVTTDAWFQVEDDGVTISTKDDGKGNHLPTGLVAYDDSHLAELVQGFYVGIDDAGDYTTDPDDTAGFRQVIDGPMPPGMPLPAGPLLYYHQAEYDRGGIFINTVLPDEETFFQDAEDAISAAIAALPLDGSTMAADLDDALGVAIDDAKSKSQYGYVDWGRSDYDVSFDVDLTRMIDKQGRYALRNRWGIANTHGNVAEWCTPGRGYDPARRWDGEASYTDAAGYGPGHPYVVVRGGSFRASADKCRSAARHPAMPDHRRMHVGFRFIIEGP